MYYNIHFSFKKEKQKSVDIANNGGNDREEKELVSLIIN